MSPHLICLSWHFNFHIISRPDPEAGHKRDLGCQPVHIKWGLILQFSLRVFSWHPWKPVRGFFCISSSPAGLCVGTNLKHVALCGGAGYDDTSFAKYLLSEMNRMERRVECCDFERLLQCDSQSRHAIGWFTSQSSHLGHAVWCLEEAGPSFVFQKVFPTQNHLSFALMMNEQKF